MPWMAYILIPQRFGATSLYIGYAISVQKGGCTDTKCVLTVAQDRTLKGAHSVLAKKCVIATPWQPAAQPLLQNGTLPGMMVCQLISLQGLAKQFGGRMPAVAAGSSAFINAQALGHLLRYAACACKFTFAVWVTTAPVFPSNPALFHLCLDMKQLGGV